MGVKGKRSGSSTGKGKGRVAGGGDSNSVTASIAAESASASDREDDDSRPPPSAQSALAVDPVPQGGKGVGAVEAVDTDLTEEDFSKDDSKLSQPDHKSSKKAKGGSHPYGLTTASVTIPTDTEDTINKLRTANKSLRLQLKEYQRALDSSLKHYAAEKAGDLQPDNSLSLERQRSRTMLQLKEKQLQAALKKVEIYKKANKVLKNKHDSLLTEDRITELENEIGAKKGELNRLLEENKHLLNIQRNQAKLLEEQDSEKVDWPAKLMSLQNDIKMYRERIKKLKEGERHTESLKTKQHEAVIKLMDKNKKLVAEITELKSLAGGNLTTPSLANSNSLSDTEFKWAIEKQRLLKQIEVLQRGKAEEKSIGMKLMKSSENEVKKLKAEVDKYKTLLEEKEKEIRLQVIQVKKLKRYLRELALGVTSQDLPSYWKREALEMNKPLMDERDLIAIERDNDGTDSPRPPPSNEKRDRETPPRKGRITTMPGGEREREKERREEEKGVKDRKSAESNNARDMENSVRVVKGKSKPSTATSPTKEKEAPAARDRNHTAPTTSTSLASSDSTFSASAVSVNGSAEYSPESIDGGGSSEKQRRERERQEEAEREAKARADAAAEFKASEEREKEKERVRIEQERTAREEAELQEEQRRAEKEKARRESEERRRVQEEREREAEMKAVAEAGEKRRVQEELRANLESEAREKAEKQQAEESANAKSTVDTPLPSKVTATTTSSRPVTNGSNKSGYYDNDFENDFEEDDGESTTKEKRPVSANKGGNRSRPTSSQKNREKEKEKAQTPSTAPVKVEEKSDVFAKPSMGGKKKKVDDYF